MQNHDIAEDATTFSLDIYFCDTNVAFKAANNAPSSNTNDEAMWAIILTKELWRKGIWSVLAILRFLPSTFMVYFLKD